MLTDPKRFQTSGELQDTFEQICNTPWMRTSCDFYIEKWFPYADDQLVAQNDVLRGMQERGEVKFVEDVFHVYFFSGNEDTVLARLEEYVHDLRDEAETFDRAA